ncbi:MAG: glycosyltransferase [Chitinophagia bacterium]|nr:glycosyltransferase [Chitinophagia bacterium]
MPVIKKLVFTVTNDLNYDRRMIRICTSLVNAGYHVTLIGFERKTSLPLLPQPFEQIRIPLIAEQGKVMYIHYWWKLYGVLMKIDADVVCAIDLDTILPVYYATRRRGIKRVHDAHEIFTELKEVISRPFVHWLWKNIANFAIPRFPVGYTIGEAYATDFYLRYGVRYGIVRNATVLKPFTIPEKKEKYILYQGAVNVGRCFEQLIPAMKHIDTRLIVCGEGNFYQQAVDLVKKLNLEQKVVFHGYVEPQKLLSYTQQAYVGITLFEDTSISNRFSLANRFFDYMHAAVPQLCMQYPEYERINEQYELASLLPPPVTAEAIADALNRLLNDTDYYNRLQQNCLQARERYCWQEQEKTLIDTYKRLEQ